MTQALTDDYLAVLAAVLIVARRRPMTDEVLVEQGRAVAESAIAT